MGAGGRSVSKVAVKMWSVGLEDISSSWTVPDSPVLAVRCYPTLPPRHLQFLKHLGYVTISGGTKKGALFGHIAVPLRTRFFSKNVKFYLSFT